MNNATLDNTLMHQKDTILALINSDEGDRASNLEQALDQLDTLNELWVNANYHYKGKELAVIVHREATALLEDTKNWKRRERLDRLVRRAYALSYKFWAAEAAWKAAA